MSNKRNKLSGLGLLSLLMGAVSLLAVIVGFFILVSTFFKTNEQGEKLKSGSLSMPPPPPNRVEKPVQIVVVDTNNSLPNRKPDIVSERAEITDYYKYVDGKWIWSE